MIQVHSEKDDQSVRLVYCDERKDWEPDTKWAEYGFMDEMSIEIGA